MFNKLMQECIKNIYENDLSVQVRYMEMICKDVRHMNYQICLEAKAFFVPNNEYLMQYTYPEILDEKYGVYNYEGFCIWHECLTFPIYDVGNSIVGLVGFNPINYLKAREVNDWSLNYYTYSKKSVMQRGRYIYCLPGIYEKSLNEGYLIIVDGMFDAIHLTAEGFNAAALMGSTITDEIVAQLRFIKKVIIISDNDAAGLKFIRQLKQSLHNVACLFQGETKDIDELLKTERKIEIIEVIRQMIDSSFLMDRYLGINVKS